MRPDADSFATTSKWCVSPRMTAPSAISASYLSVLASFCKASGASSAPGTLITVRAVTRNSASRLRQASSIATPMRSLKRERTIPTRRSSPPESARAPPSAVPRPGRLFDVARDLQLPPGHARHLARRGHEAHLADPEIAQDLSADSVREEIHLGRPFGPLGRCDALDQLRRGLRAVEQHHDAFALGGDALERVGHRPGVRPWTSLEQVEHGERRVHAHQRFLVGHDLSPDEGKLGFSADLFQVGDEPERPEAGLDQALCHALDERFVLAPEVDELGYRAELDP